MVFNEEHAKQWILDHLWEYFPEKRVMYTEESVEILSKMFQDYTERHYTTYVSDPVYDKETRTLSVTVGIRGKNDTTQER